MDEKYEVVPVVENENDIPAEALEELSNGRGEEEEE